MAVVGSVRFNFDSCCFGFQPSSLLPPSTNVQSQQQHPSSSLSQSPDTEQGLQQLSSRQERILQQLDGLQERVRALAAGMSVDVAQVEVAAVAPRGTRRVTPSSPSCVTTQALASHEQKGVLATESCLGLLTGAPRLDVTSDVVVTADPRRPPYFLPPLLRLLGRVVPMTVQQHVHSSVQEMPPSLNNFLNAINNPSSSPTVPAILVRVIWSVAPPTIFGDRSFPSSSAASAASSRVSVKGKVAAGPVQTPRLVVSPLATTEIAGENNICRYLARLLELVCEQSKQTSGPTNTPGVPMPFYEGLPRYLTSECDAWLDDCQAWLIAGSCRGRANFLNKLSNKLGETEEARGCLLSQQPTLADVFVSSSLAVMGRGKVALNVAAWRDRCNAYWGEGGATTS